MSQEEIYLKKQEIVGVIKIQEESVHTIDEIEEQVHIQQVEKEIPVEKKFITSPADVEMQRRVTIYQNCH